jgi:hypothetical protein
MLIGGGLVHGLAGVAAIVANLPWWVQAAFVAGIARSLIGFGYHQGSRRSRGFIARIELLDGRWRLETGDGAEYWGRLTGGYAHPLLVILNFRLESGGRRSVTLLPDAADPDALRRLRVWLRTSQDAAADHPW